MFFLSVILIKISLALIYSRVLGARSGLKLEHEEKEWSIILRTRRAFANETTWVGGRLVNSSTPRIRRLLWCVSKRGLESATLERESQTPRSIKKFGGGTIKSRISSICAPLISRVILPPSESMKITIKKAKCSVCIQALILCTFWAKALTFAATAITS